jgi:hypothetical protein
MGAEVRTKNDGSARSRASLPTPLGRIRHHTVERRFRHSSFPCGRPSGPRCARRVSTLRYCEIELATWEKTLLALEPMSRIVPTTMTKITANMTAYSAMSCPASSRHNLRRRFLINSSQGNGVEWADPPESLHAILCAVQPVQQDSVATIENHWISEGLRRLSRILSTIIPCSVLPWSDNFLHTLAQSNCPWLSSQVPGAGFRQGNCRPKEPPGGGSPTGRAGGGSKASLLAGDGAGDGGKGIARTHADGV